MNKIDPDEEEDEEENGSAGGSNLNTPQKSKTGASIRSLIGMGPENAGGGRRGGGSGTQTPQKEMVMTQHYGAGRQEPARSSHQPHQQAFLQQQSSLNQGQPGQRERDRLLLQQQQQQLVR